jgi:CheY-specific phosphatase CheX
MKNRIEKKLGETAVRTFEDTCFMYSVPELKEVQSNLPMEAAAEVKYRGNFTGRVVLEARGGLFKSIAVNMLGNDHPTETQMRDALGEIANIICGNVIPALGESPDSYRIENPRYLTGAECRSVLLGEPLVTLVLNLNLGRADVKFYVDGYFPVRE